MQSSAEVSYTGQSCDSTEEPADPRLSLLLLDGVDWENPPFLASAQERSGAWDDFCFEANFSFDQICLGHTSQAMFDDGTFSGDIPLNTDNLIQQGSSGAFINANDSPFESSPGSNASSIWSSWLEEDPPTPAATPALTYGAPTPPQSQASPQPGVCARAIDRNTHPSSRPRRTALKARRCKYVACAYEAPDAKDVGRHELQVHQKPKPGTFSWGWYTCRCSYQTSRKDDLKRHFKTCKKEHEYESDMCRCLRRFIGHDEFCKHISKCGAKSKGRPRQLSLPSSQMLNS